MSYHSVIKPNQVLMTRCRTSPCGSWGAAASSVRFGRCGAEPGTGRELRVRLRGAAPPRAGVCGTERTGRQRGRQHGAGAVPRSALAALPGSFPLRPMQQHPVRVQTVGADEGWAGTGRGRCPPVAAGGGFTSSVETPVVRGRCCRPRPHLVLRFCRAVCELCENSPSENGGQEKRRRSEK